MKFVLIAGLVGYAAYTILTGQTPSFGGFTGGGGFVVYSTPVSLDTSPKQSRTSKDQFEFKGYNIKPLAEFDIIARVLSRKYYSSDKEAELSPVDLALGWGPMSRDTVIKDIDISQRGRWYFWETMNFPIPRQEIETNSANMHIIPANKTVEEKLQHVKRGHVIKIKGYLVECRQDHWKWRSSTSRKDTGNGACEIIYVEDFRIKKVN